MWKEFERVSAAFLLELPSAPPNKRSEKTSIVRNADLRGDAAWRMSVSGPVAHLHECTIGDTDLYFEQFGAFTSFFDCDVVIAERSSIKNLSNGTFVRCDLNIDAHQRSSALHCWVSDSRSKLSPSFLDPFHVEAGSWLTPSYILVSQIASIVHHVVLSRTSLCAISYDTLADVSTKLLNWGWKSVESVTPGDACFSLCESIALLRCSSGAVQLYFGHPGTLKAYQEAGLESSDALLTGSFPVHLRF